MPAITQVRSIIPFTGPRYGSFAGRQGQGIPNFMRGSLRAYPAMDGEIKISPVVSGAIRVDNSLIGKVETNP